MSKIEFITKNGSRYALKTYHKKGLRKQLEKFYDASYNGFSILVPGWGTGIDEFLEIKKEAFLEGIAEDTYLIFVPSKKPDNRIYICHEFKVGKTLWIYGLYFFPKIAEIDASWQSGRVGEFIINTPKLLELKGDQEILKFAKKQ